MYLISAAIIKEHRNSPIGVNRTTGQVVASLKEIGTNNKAVGVNSNGEAAGKDTVRAHIARDTVSRDTATVIGMQTGINSITTTSIGASNNKADRLLQLAAKL